MLTFAALVHEIQGRVASIGLYSSEVVQDKRRHNQDWLDGKLARLKAISSEIQRIVDAVKRLEEDEPLERQPVDISSLSAEIVRRHVERTPALPVVQLKIQTNIQIWGDPGEIEIVLENLIGNALKFSAIRSVPEICISASTDRESTVVNVSDNGIGLAPEDCIRIFHPFTRCHPGFDGTGIGLAVSHRIVKRHGGRIWAEGEPGRGTTVSFSI